LLNDSPSGACWPLAGNFNPSRTWPIAFARPWNGMQVMKPSQFALDSANFCGFVDLAEPPAPSLHRCPRPSGSLARIDRDEGHLDFLLFDFVRLSGGRSLSTMPNRQSHDATCLG
jgi:hypothetical protein